MCTRFGPFRRSRVRMPYHRPIGKFSLVYPGSKRMRTRNYSVGPLPLTSFSHPPHIHLTSLMWWMRPGLPRFSCSSASMYYTEPKPKNTKWGRSGNEASFYTIGMLAFIPSDNKIHFSQPIFSPQTMHASAIKNLISDLCTINLCLFEEGYSVS